MNQEKIIVIDFGGQYNQLVARRVRECHVVNTLLNLLFVIGFGMGVAGVAV